MGTLAIKDARVELKTTRDTKDLLSKAALLDGMDLSAFMLACAVEKARAVLRDHTAINLSAQGQLELVRVLQQQPQPTPAIQALRQQPRLKVRAE